MYAIKKKKIKKRLRIAIHILILFCLVGACYEVRRIVDSTGEAESNLIDGHFDHLTDIVVTIDHSLLDIFVMISDEMTLLTQDDVVLEGEKRLLEEHDPALLQDILYREMDRRKEYVSYVMVMQQDEVLVCSKCGSGCNMTVYENSQEITPNIVVCREDDDKYYTGICVPSREEDLKYFVLIDSNRVYDYIVPHQLWEKLWVVIYDRQSGLLMQNHENQPTYMVLTEDEIEKRQDGYTYLLESERGGGSAKAFYMYNNYYGEEVPEAIVTLPSHESLNQRLAIAVAMDSQEIFAKLSESNTSLYWNIGILAAEVGVLMLCLLMLLQASRDDARQLEIQEKEAAMQKMLQEAKVKNSMSQLQPHFLYNALASIREIVLENPKYGSDLIYDFTRHLRACLRAASDDSLIPFSQELENIRAYVAIEKMRFEGQFVFCEDLKETDFQITALTIQPLIENAIRHGICEKRMSCGQVKLSTWREAGQICILVEDNGCGFDYAAWEKASEEEKVDSIGLKNSISSLHLRLCAQVSVETAPGKGTKIKILIPQSQF